MGSNSWGRRLHGLLEILPARAGRLYWSLTDYEGARYNNYNNVSNVNNAEVVMAKCPYCQRSFVEWESHAVRPCSGWIKAGKPEMVESEGLWVPAKNGEAVQVATPTAPAPDTSKPARARKTSARSTPTQATTPTPPKAQSEPREAAPVEATHSSPKPTPLPPARACETCGDRHYAKGLCRRCYQREAMRRVYAAAARDRARTTSEH